MSTRIIVILLAMVVVSCSSVAQTPTPPITPVGAVAPKPTMKPITDFITAEAVQDSGIFNVIRVDDKFYYEIPKNEFGKEFLLVTRIAKTPQIGYGGEESNTEVITFERKYNTIFLKTKSYQNVANDTTPLYQAIRQSNFEEIVVALPILAFNKDSSSVLVEVTSLFITDVSILTPNKGIKSANKLGMLDRSRSYIEYIKSFPTNVEVENVITFVSDGAPQNPATKTATFTMHHSMVRLPDQPMRPRFADPRVGFFSTYKTEYSDNINKTKNRAYILRWKLEPKDTAAFLRGELVELVKPITYYIDPATPYKWRPFLKKGVESWNKAFEKAGFKNAIRALDPPSKEEDPDWSPEDARYSVIRYFASPIENAYGPNIHDPRSGEIIESDIGWFHNVMNIMSNLYFVQAMADPRTNSYPLPDDLTGELIAYVCAHEVGHTLGFPHNMRASNSYPVDSLRSTSFTSKYGITASIMDYSRFNYVAQPGDNVAMMSSIGPYDMFVTNWGYRPIINATSPEEELPTLREWAKETLKDPMLRFGAQQWAVVDPSSQIEDIGDDAIKASTYGLQNIERRLKSLFNAFNKSGSSYEELYELYNVTLSQYRNEVNHVINLIGGVEINRKVYGDESGVYAPVAKERQEQALQFVLEKAFKTPNMFLDTTITNKLSVNNNYTTIVNTMSSFLRNTLANEKLVRLIDQEAANKNSFTVVDLFNKVVSSIFNSQSPDYFQRMLQRTLVEELQKKASFTSTSSGFMIIINGFNTTAGVSNTDIRGLARIQLENIKTFCAKSKSTDPIIAAHYKDLTKYIEKMLDPKN
jgi:hypothetical protein